MIFSAPIARATSTVSSPMLPAPMIATVSPAASRPRRAERTATDAGSASAACASLRPSAYLKHM